jgi:DNA-binding NarL/FixJ family response regulator
MIVLIEDDECDALLFSELMDSANVKDVVVFESLTEALENVPDASDTLVFSDLSLPEGRDETILDRLSAHFVHAKVVIVSGHDARFLGDIVVGYPKFEYVSKSDLSTDVLNKYLNSSQSTFTSHF